jgi:cytochrome P450
VIALEWSLISGSVKGEFPWLWQVLNRIPLKAFQTKFNTVPFVREYANRAVDASKGHGPNTNLFGTMIALAEEGETMDDEDVKTEAANLIVAGSDTTAVTLTYLCWAVVSRPALRDALVAEVAKLPAGFTDADVEELPLTNAVIEETLRLYAAAPGSMPRVVPKGGTMLGSGKHFVPAGTVVGSQCYTMHRNAQIFPDPEMCAPLLLFPSPKSPRRFANAAHRFDPNRWLPGGSALSEEAKSAFAPWGGGSRTCMGVNIARTELRLGTALFFRAVTGAKLSPKTTPQSMEMLNFFLIAPVSHQCMIDVAR